MKLFEWGSGAALVLATSAALIAPGEGEGRFSERPIGALERAHVAGPPPGHTGGFGEPTCIACHLEFDLNLGGRLSIEGVPASYDPGHSYIVSLVLRSTEMVAAGFQLSARFQTTDSEGRQAGAWVPLDETVHTVPDSTSDVLYLQHTAAATSVRDPEFATWSFEWIAPAESGKVFFHASANSANGDNSPLGDLVYAVEAQSAAPGIGPAAPATSPRRVPEGGLHDHN